MLTSLVLPSSAGTAYLRWLPHPVLQEIATIDMGNFKFEEPERRSTGKDG